MSCRAIDDGPRSFIQILQSDLPALVAAGWLPDSPPFVPIAKLSAEEMATFNGPGPGTELAKLIEDAIGATAFSGCGCNSRIVQMNKWGPDECMRNIKAIVGWLREAYKKISPDSPYSP